jgi:hypothetical protein
LASGTDIERKSWMPAFAGMTWEGRWVKAHVGGYKLVIGAAGECPPDARRFFLTGTFLVSARGFLRAEICDSRIRR